MKATALLVKVRGDGKAFAKAAANSLGVSGSDIETVLRVPPDSSFGIGLIQTGATWLRVDTAGDVQNAWNRAHALIATRGSLGIAGAEEIITAEPDFEQEWIVGNQPPPGGPAFAPAAAPACVFNDQTDVGGQAKGPRAGWSTGNEFSQLAKAAGSVSDAKQKAIIIAHLDTGFDPGHGCKPVNLALNKQHNFVVGENPDDATDVTHSGVLKNPGHGPGTIGILAGGKINRPEWSGYTDPIGGAPFSTIVPIRIANGVVHFTTSSMAKGFNYAISIGAHVLTMSMGGLTSDLLVDVVNLAYDNGVFLVTAAGNHFSFTPMPTSIVFPARYRRVLAACGVMADGRPYWGLRPLTMQGNHGPDSKMETALGAYTPNIAWPERGCANNVDMDGAGTSSATPQIAAAAALWIAEHWNTLKNYPPWARVEAAREALFRSAGKSTAKMGAAETKEMIGKGVMQAHAALSRLPVPVVDLTKLPPARPSWPWLNLLTEGGVSLGPRSKAQERQIPMLKLELTQMAQRFGSIDGAIADPDLPAEKIPVYERIRYLERALEEGNPSKPLRRFLENLPGIQATRREVLPVTPIKRHLRTPENPARRLRVYSLDPSLAQSNDFFTVNETTLSLPWDEEPEGLHKPGRDVKPGPVGEYLEVVDVDPASNKVYDPIDLNDKFLLAQDGLAPSEGNPQFHQQMVYAVGMLTIGTFERALGRKALWAPYWDASKRRQAPVQRLRIYPHALRAANAYYSPDKRALLFGYFQSSDETTGGVAPGSMVFTCLSSDIIAHEMSHALLDGLHHRFTEASNPDVPAFHEAFADIVAIFQHFTFTNLVRFEIGRVKGELTAATLLGGLAMQFGQGSGRDGPLRNYSDPSNGEFNYQNTEEAHDRGSILVFAIYDAFLKIVARRSADLIRLATGGTGILGASALHPDLVERLTDETTKVAKQILNICIRALDYCPAVDITFGEYLRGLVTADTDAMPEDPWGYRVALIEAFRTRGILPRDVKTVSKETLTWNTYFDKDSSAWIKDAVRSLDVGWNLDMDRADVMEVNEKNRWKFWNALNAAFKVNPELLRQFGLQRHVPRYNNEGDVVSTRNRNAETFFEVYGVRPARRVAQDGSFRTELVASSISASRSGMTKRTTRAAGSGLEEGRPSSSIRGRATPRCATASSRIRTRSRQERQRLCGRDVGLSPLRSLYFGGEAIEPFAIMHSKMGGY